MTLVSNANWAQQAMLSLDEKATLGELRDNEIVLNQTFTDAEAGNSVELNVEVLLTDLPPDKDVVFKIGRGDIGSTRVEFSRNVDGQWVVFKTVFWDVITGDGQNENVFTLTNANLFAELASSTSPQPEGAVAVDPISILPAGTDGYPWWNDTVFYEIFVRSFYDSNADGIGDFNGITEKLDYLNDGDPNTTTDLGVTGIWLMPIFDSPSYHGYNVNDYYTVNPQYGTLDDFKNLLAAAHERGIRVIIDMTFNHTSAQHPWFVSAQDPASSYHDWYIWSNTDPGYTGSWGQQVWFPLNGMYYYGTFSANFPDLNYENPEVVAEMEEVTRYWLEDIGVDGFRLDAAKHIVEEGALQANSDSTHEWWETFRPFYKGVNPKAMMVSEIWDDPALNAEYVQGDEVDLSFEFFLAYAYIEAVNTGKAAPVYTLINNSFGIVPDLQLATFLTNHDQVRVMDQFGYDTNKAKVAASMLMTSPGVPFVFYGEELGMQGQKPDERIRAPMQWSGGTYGGFTSSVPWEELAPGWETYNVALETNDPSSMLSHYRSLIQARNQHAALRVGDYTLVTTDNEAVYSMLRVSQNESVLVLVNLSGEPISDCSLSVAQSDLAEGSYTLAAIMGGGDFAALTVDGSGGFSDYVPVSQLPPYSTFILQLQN